MIGIIIRAQVGPDQRHELMQMGQRWLDSNHLPAACLERHIYQDATSPADLLLTERWSDEAAMISYLSSDHFRALVGAVKVLGKLVDVCACETKIVESG